jgi:hypothetical protein
VIRAEKKVFPGVAVVITAHQFSIFGVHGEIVFPGSYVVE